MSVTIGEVREPLDWFVCEMETQLRANDHKDGWADLTDQQALHRIDEERKELISASQDLRDIRKMHRKHGESPHTERAVKFIAKQVIKECADVANFAMMLADNTSKDEL